VLLQIKQTVRLIHINKIYQGDAIMKKLLNTLLSVSILCFSIGSFAEEAKGPSLFDRMGGEKVARQIVADTWANHTSNPIVKNRFEDSDGEYVKQKVYEIFAMATGADVKYTGKAMKATHATMNINEAEFNAVIDDVMAALGKNKIAQQEKNEVLAILWSVRPDVVNSNLTTKTLTTEVKTVK
jgi:hemoglobin